MSEQQTFEDRRRALSPDARLLSRLTARQIGPLEQALERARQAEDGLERADAHAAERVLKRIEVVELEEKLGRARIAASYRNPDH
jgi:hypothetical protein